MHLVFLGSISLLGGLMLTFGEIRRLFTHSLSAFLENLWDWRRRHTFKIVFGIGLMYAGAVAIGAWLNGDSLLISFNFPYLSAPRQREDFMTCFALGTGLWILTSLVTAATTPGDVFPEWVTRTFYRVVKTILYLAWAATGVMLAINLGGNRAGDIAGGVLWLVGLLELRFGMAAGFEIYSSTSSPTGATSESFSTWYPNFEDRPVLYVMSVLLTLGFAALCSLSPA